MSDLALVESAKRAGVKRACPNKVMAHIWFMHDAHLGCALFFLDLLAEIYIYIYSAVNDSHGYSMSLVCSWNELGMSYVPISSSPFCTRPFWRMPTDYAASLIIGMPDVLTKSLLLGTKAEKKKKHTEPFWDLFLGARREGVVFSGIS